MSLLPLIFEYSDPWELRRSRHNDWDMFGLGVTPREIRQLVSFPSWASRAFKESPSDLSVGNVGKDGFQACIDVKQFKPNEVTVKTVDNTIVIEGKHEERQDEHGLISRSFVRKYVLPKGYDPKEVVSTLSSDGVLTIQAPLPKKELESNERVIQIQQTGPARINVKENKPENEEEDKSIEKKSEEKKSEKK